MKFKKTISTFALATLIAVTVTAQAAAYTIQAGDSLSKIADAHGLDWHSLQAANPSITNPDLIYAGSELAIPTAAQPASATQSVTSAAETSPTGLTGCDLARSLINQYDWNHEVAYNVMVAESSCNPDAANWNDSHGTCVGSFGLFQINCTHGQLFDPAANVAAAYAMYQASGWQPWSFLTCKKVACY